MSQTKSDAGSLAIVARFVRPLLGNWSWHVQKAHLHMVVRNERVGRPLEAAELQAGDPRGPKNAIGIAIGAAVCEI